MTILTCPGASRPTLSTSNSSSIPNNTAVAFDILAALLLDVVRDQQHAEAASPYASGTPLKFEEPAMAGGVPRLLRHQWCEQRRHRSRQRTDRAPPAHRPRLSQPRQLPTPHAPHRRWAEAMTTLSGEEPDWSGPRRDHQVRFRRQPRLLAAALRRGDGSGWAGVRHDPDPPRSGSALAGHLGLSGRGCDAAGQRGMAGL